jgi:hypothetical protein
MAAGRLENAVTRLRFHGFANAMNEDRARKKPL